MRIVRYKEDADKCTVSIKVEMTRKEFEATDVRTLDIERLREEAKKRISGTLK